MNQIEVYKRRTNVFEMSFMHLLGEDIYTSQIRVGRNHTTPLIASWTVTKKPGVGNVLIFSMDDSVVENIVQTYGWMDLKRVSGGEPLPVLRNPIPVLFIDPITE